MSFVYVPIIKGKQNDCRAVTMLTATSRPLIKPLLDLVPFAPGKSVDQQLADFIGRVEWVAGDGPLFVDFYGARLGETTAAGQLAVLAGFNTIAELGLAVTPVYGFQRDDAVWVGLAPVVARLGQGFCFRIDSDDLDDQSEDTWTNILERTTQLDLNPADVDLLIDLRSLRDRDVRRLENVVLDFVALRPAKFVPRTVILAGSSALMNVALVPGDGAATVRREELRLWARLCADLIDSYRLVFADYGVVHPEFFPGGPAPHANAKIRYTTDATIHYFRGHSLRKPPGYAQFRKLSKRVIQSGHYQGPDFSAGDRFVADCASSESSKTGNLPKWVFVTQNHHFELTTRQLQLLMPRVEAAASAQAAESLITD